MPAPACNAQLPILKFVPVYWTKLVQKELLNNDASIKQMRMETFWGKCNQESLFLRMCLLELNWNCSCVANEDNEVGQADSANQNTNTYVFIDVEERCHGGVVDGAQIRLVPVDVEHSSYIVASCSVAGHVLQQKGLLTTGGRRTRKQEKEFIIRINLNFHSFHCPSLTTRRFLMKVKILSALFSCTSDALGFTKTFISEWFVITKMQRWTYFKKTPF